MRWTWCIEKGNWAIGIRLRSWALPALVTWTPSLFEIAIGPIFISRQEDLTLPF